MQQLDNWLSKPYTERMGEDYTLEQAIDFYFSLCLQHCVDPNPMVSFEAYDLDCPFHGYSPEAAAKEEFMRIHDESVGILEVITNIEFDSQTLPETQRDVFELIFDPSTELSTPSKLEEEGV